MASKRKARGGASKTKQVKQAKAVRSFEGQALVFDADKGPIPVELLVQIFLKLDTLSQHSFGVANHHFRQVFLNNYEAIYGQPYGSNDPKTGKRFLPVKMNARLEQPDRLPLKFRLMMRSWMPRNLTWDPDSQKYLGPETKFQSILAGKSAALKNAKGIFDNKIKRAQDYEEKMKSYRDFLNANETAFQSARDAHIDDVYQTHYANKEYRNEDDASNSDSNYSAEGTPKDSALEYPFQSKVKPKNYLAPGLKKVKKPKHVKMFREGDEFLVGAVNDTEDITMRVLKEY